MSARLHRWFSTGGRHVVDTKKWNYTTWRRNVHHTCNRWCKNTPRRHASCTTRNSRCSRINTVTAQYTWLIKLVLLFAVCIILLVMYTFLHCYVIFSLLCSYPCFKITADIGELIKEVTYLSSGTVMEETITSYLRFGGWFHPWLISRTVWQKLKSNIFMHFKNWKVT